jgi:hypothetical protein
VGHIRQPRFYPFDVRVRLAGLGAARAGLGGDPACQTLYEQGIRQAVLAHLGLLSPCKASIIIDIYLFAKKMYILACF